MNSKALALSKPTKRSSEHRLSATAAQHRTSTFCASCADSHSNVGVEMELHLDTDRRILSHKHKTFGERVNAWAERYLG